mmetsp:Transcript_32320/g.102528  ORF Transcript_32320/g.102528 Transcript_32320/m.102528 type:complete len:217 (+) Transcript_32320:54-704(+)
MSVCKWYKRPECSPLHANRDANDFDCTSQTRSAQATHDGARAHRWVQVVITRGEALGCESQVTNCSRLCGHRPTLAGRETTGGTVATTSVTHCRAATNSPPTATGLKRTLGASIKDGRSKAAQVGEQVRLDAGVTPRLEGTGTTAWNKCVHSQQARVVNHRVGNGATVCRPERCELPSRTLTVACKLHHRHEVHKAHRGSKWASREERHLAVKAKS